MTVKQRGEGAQLNTNTGHKIMARPGARFKVLSNGIAAYYNHDHVAI
jgi:hypothetical protein